MRERFVLLLNTGLVTLVLVGLSACGLVGTPQAPTPFPDSAYTAAAQTIVAQMTVTAIAGQPTDQPTTTAAAETPEPATDTPMETPTAVPSDTPQPTETPEETGTPEEEDTPTTTAAPQATAPPLGRLVFEDDFSDEGNWFVDSGDNFGFEYEQGGYQIYVNILNATIWTIRNLEFSDVQLEVDGQRAAGSMDGYYGLLCRHQDEEESYYALVVAEDGFYGIGKSEEGEFDFIQSGNAEAGLIRSGDEPNRVRADCIGETLTLYVNGQRLLEVQDDDFDSGIIGLVAGTRNSDEFTALFDDIAVYEP